VSDGVATYVTGQAQIHTVCGPTVVAQVQTSSATVWNGCIVRLSEIRRQIVADWRSSCAEGSIAQVGVRPTDKKRTKSVSRAHLLGWASVTRQLDSVALYMQR